MPDAKRLPYYSQVEDAILAKLDSGEFSPGSRIPSIRELAQQFEVAKSTVERAIYRLADRGILRAQQGKGVFVSETLPRREGGKTHVIGLLSAMHISLYTSRGFYSEVLAGIQASLMQQNWSLLVINERGLARIEEGVNLHSQLVDGYIVLGPVSNKFISLIRQAGKPMVLVDHDGSTMGFDSVVADNVKGSLLITRRLIELGHTDFLFVGGILKLEPDPEERHLIDTSARERFEGFRLALETAGIDASDNRLVRVRERTSQDSADAFSDAWKQGARPTAIVTFDSGSAQGIIRFLEKKGRKCPHDVSIAGFGGGSTINGLQFTGVDFDYRLMGQIGGKLAIDRVERGFDAFRKEIVPVFFIEGQTVASAPKAAAAKT